MKQFISLIIVLCIYSSLANAQNWNTIILDTNQLCDLSVK